jgi:hypothetical protein
MESKSVKLERPNNDGPKFTSGAAAPDLPPSPPSHSSNNLALKRKSDLQSQDRSVRPSMQAFKYEPSAATAQRQANIGNNNGLSDNNRSANNTSHSFNASTSHPTPTSSSSSSTMSIEMSSLSSAVKMKPSVANSTTQTQVKRAPMTADALNGHMVPPMSHSDALNAIQTNSFVQAFDELFS